MQGRSGSLRQRLRVRAATASWRALAGLVLGTASCALGISFDSYSVEPGAQPVRLYGASGTVEGLEEGRLTLRWNGAVLSGVGNGPFLFRPAVADGVPWHLEMFGERCSSDPDKGIIAGTDVTRLLVRCGKADITSGDTRLLELSFSNPGVMLSPPFTASTHAYTLRPTDPQLEDFTMENLPPGTATALAVHRGASVTVAGQAVDMEGRAPVQLVPGTNRIDVVVTAPDRASTARYRVVAQVGFTP